MSRVIGPVLLLVCATMGASAPLLAQARIPVRKERGSEMPAEQLPPVRDEATRARMFVEAQAWLSRLTGRFEVAEKRITIGGVQNFTGTALCSHIGSGPGVQCSIRMLGIGTSKTSLLLFFGINPETSEVRLALVDTELVTTRSGLLAGDAVDFADNWNVCYRVYTHCWMAAAVTAPPSGDIFMKFSIDYYGNVRKHPLTTKSGHTADKELRLRRERPLQTDGAR